MARVKRFKILEAARRKYKAVSTTPGEPMYEYIQFKAGNKTLTFTGTKYESKEQVAIDAFGLDATFDPILTVVSGRAMKAENLTACGITAAALGHPAADAAATGVPNPGFIPAKAVIKAGTITAPTGKSGITNINRTTPKQPSFTYPFGKIAEGDRQVERMTAIATLVATGTAKRTVTFQPERFFV